MHAAGYGPYYSLGTGNGRSVYTPRRVAGSLLFRSVSVGNTFTCGVLKDDGRGYCWGGMHGLAPPAAALFTFFLYLHSSGSMH